MSARSRKLAAELRAKAEEEYQISQEKSKHGGKRAGSGKPKGYRVTMATREKIRGAMLVTQLEKIAKGEVVAEPHQVTAALGLLRFQLPHASEITGKDGEALTVNLVQFQEKDK